MAMNPDFLKCREERKNDGFFKVVQNMDLSSENTRALPHDFVLNFSDNELSQKMKIKTQWGRSWEVGISKNPRFYFMEKLGWEKFVRDNALGHREFLTFTHKGEMNFTVNIFKIDGKEMMQPPQSTTFFASSSCVKTEQREDDNTEMMQPPQSTTFFASSSRVKTEQREDDSEDEVVVYSELSNRGPTTPAQPSGRKLKLGKKTAEETQTSKKTEKMVNARRDSASASSSSATEFTILFKKSYLIFLRLPSCVAEDHMPDEKTVFKIHHPDGKKSWNVVYLVKFGSFSGGWRQVVREYPLAVKDTCKFTFLKPDELLLVVSKF